MPQIDLLNAVFMFLKDTSLFFRGLRFTRWYRLCLPKEW